MKLLNWKGKNFKTCFDFSSFKRRLKSKWYENDDADDEVDKRL